MEINITRFITDCDPFEFSASRLERGDNAGPETWANAQNEASRAPLLTTPKQLEALRDYVRDFGAWEDDEIAAWSDDKCNALFIQLVSRNMREAGLGEVDLDDFDWEKYERRAEKGNISGNIFRATDGQIYYCLGS